MDGENQKKKPNGKPKGKTPHPKRAKSQHDRSAPIKASMQQQRLVQPSRYAANQGPVDKQHKRSKNRHEKISLQDMQQTSQFRRRSREESPAPMRHKRAKSRHDKPVPMEVQDRHSKQSHRKSKNEVPANMRRKKIDKPHKTLMSGDPPVLPAKEDQKSKSRRVPGKKHRLPQLQLNLNEILRIGSVLECYGVEVERRKAFEWLAFNCADLQQDSYETAHKLLIALGDLSISKELAHETVRVLVDKKIITEREYEDDFSIIERSPPNQCITVAQLSHLIAIGAAYYAQQKP